MNADNETLLSPEESAALRDAMGRARDKAHSSAPGQPVPSAADPATAERVAGRPLTLHVELGQRQMRVDELVQITTGSLLELDARAGAPLGIYADQTLIAHGEAVVVGDHYGVRVTELVTSSERMQRLGERR